MQNKKDHPKKTITREQLESFQLSVQGYADALNAFCEDDSKWDATTGALNADETVPPGPTPPQPPH
jgi:hypothetical protein